MKKHLAFYMVLSLFTFSCREVLNPVPVNVLTQDLALSRPEDVDNIQIGLYNAFRDIAAPTIIAGDFTADLIKHNGTFTQYLELGTKQISSSNSAVSAMWTAIYKTAYVSNFILERLPDLKGVPSDKRRNVLGAARFLRGYAYFIGVYTFGSIPLVTATDIETNTQIERSSKEDVLKFILEDYQFALQNLPQEPINQSFAGFNAVRAALARYYLYSKEWTQAEFFATQVIDSKKYSLVPYEEIVLKDFTRESILEVGYTAVDDPGTSALGLNDLFIGRREVIPSNENVSRLFSIFSDSRSKTIAYDPDDNNGGDNGWSIQKYGSQDSDNNNITIFRLGEMHLIRAEARVNQNKLSGEGGGESDLNIIRGRANVPPVTFSTKADALEIIENERVLELSYEGHRWYDLVRTGRAEEVMKSFSPNWKNTYELWPIPINEIQNNASLTQNPGY